MTAIEESCPVMRGGDYERELTRGGDLTEDGAYCRRSLIMNGSGLRDVIYCRVGRDGVQREEMSLEYSQLARRAQSPWSVVGRGGNRPRRFVVRD